MTGDGQENQSRNELCLKVQDFQPASDERAQVGVGNKCQPVRSPDSAFGRCLPSVVCAIREPRAYTFLISKYFYLWMPYPSNSLIRSRRAGTTWVPSQFLVPNLG